MLASNAGTSAASVRAVVLRDQPDAIEALQALPVIGAAGRVFPLGELASIRAEEDTRGRFFRINGEPAVALDVVRSPGADAIKTAAALREAVAALRPSLPLGVRLEIANDESVDLARELRDLTMRGGIAFVAVLLVLLLFLRRWRAVAAVMGTTAVAIAATALTLYVFHVPANLLTLAGLCMGIGILVQNAIVVVERLAQAPDTAEGRAEATRRIAPAVMGSTLTTAVVLFPFLYLQGMRVRHSCHLPGPSWWRWHGVSSHRSWSCRHWAPVWRRAVCAGRGCVGCTRGWCEGRCVGVMSRSC